MKTDHFEILGAKGGEVVILATNHRLANKLNATLREYADRGKLVRIKDGEEPVFWISRSKLPLFRALIPKAYSQDAIIEKMTQLLDELEIRAIRENNYEIH